jgi:phage-related protein
LNKPDKDLFKFVEITTPPMSEAARKEAGYLLRRLQQGEILSLPESRPMPSIGAHCHELRIQDTDKTWRIFYRIDSDVIVALEILNKKTQATPRGVIETCRQRLRLYEAARSRKDE